MHAQIVTHATTPATQHQRRGMSSLVGRTVLAAGAAGVANLAVFAAARMLWRVPAGFALFGPLSILVTTAIASIVAGLGLGAIRRLTRRGNIVFLVALALVTMLSLAGPFQAMAGAVPGMPRATLATGITMIVLHLLTAGMIAAALLRPAKRGP